MEELRHRIFFNYLDDDQFNLFKSISKKKHYTKGSILFYEKEKPTSLILLTEGTLKVYKTDLKGNELLMHRFLPLTFVAENVIMGGVVYPASSSFETDGAVIEIDFEKFKNEFFGNHDISFMLFKSLSKKISDLENIISLDLILDSTARIAKYIYDDHKEFKSLKNYQLAEHLHMTPETLSRIFKKLVKLGLISKSPDGYVMKDEEGLKSFFE